jgi:hypothetical protein
LKPRARRAARVTDFDYYDFIAIVMPGAVVAVGVALVYASIPSLVGEGFNVAGLTIFTVLAFVVGHLVAAIGTRIENAYWTLVWGGWPSDWVRTGKRHLLAPQQVGRLPAAIKAQTGIAIADDLSTVPPSDWRSIVAQMYAAVAAAGRAARVDKFNGNYGLFRGLVLALAIDLLVVLYAGAWEHAPALGGGRSVAFIAALLVFAILLAAWQMKRYSAFYAKEVLVQFLQIPPPTATPP